MVAQHRDLSVGLKRSLALHGGILFLIVFKSLVLPGKTIPYVPTLRVDIVGLPDVLKKDLSQISKQLPSPEIEEAMKKAEADAKKIKTELEKKAKEAPKPEEAEKAEKDEMVLKPKKPVEQEISKARERKNKSALDRIKALAKLGVDTPASEKLTKEKPAGQLIKGNAISKGTSLSGDAKESAAANYYDILRDRLQENWALPVWLARQNLSARVQIFIDNHGRLKGFKFLKVSGNSQFDEAVKRAINESQPFAAPPAELAGTVLADGVLVGFPL